MLYNLLKLRDFIARNYLWRDLHMSKTMKKLICALLSSAMLLTSVGLVGFASEEAPAATEAPAEAAEATEAPAADTTVTAPGPAQADNSAYDSDDYYRRALEMTSALGIISGYEDGSVQPGANVTRAEMATIVLNMLKITATGGYRGIYSDVAESHWAATQIQAATDQGIIHGMGDGTFMPDGNVTYEQVCVMLVQALNYGDEAVRYGGWSNHGYLNVATGLLDLTDSAKGDADAAAERGLVIKMVYNALNGPYKEQKGIGSLGQPEYNTNKTLAESRFDVKEGKGILKATATTSIVNSKLLTNQILIDVEDDNNDDDEGTLYETALTSIDDYVGANITYYYQDKASSAETVLTVFSTGSKTKTEVLDIEDIEEFSGFDTGAPVIKMYSSSDKKFETDVEPTIVYNGQTITNADLDELDNNDARKWVYEYEDDGYTIKKDENGDEVRHEADMNEFLKPRMGSVRLIDTNSNGKYETIVVEKYEQMVVTAATASSLSGKINGVNERLKNLDDTDKVVTVTREGAAVRVRNLKANDVASLKRDLDNEVIDIVVTAESFEGKISSRGPKKGDDDVLITVDGTKYPVDINALPDASAGKECIFYTDSFGRIGYIEAASANGMLASGEAYGWVLSAYMSEDGESTMVKLMTQDGAVDYTLADNVDLWAPGEKTHGKTDDAGEKIQNIHSKKSYLKTTPTNYQIRLVKFKANSNNEITKMYFAVADTATDDESALRIHNQDFNGIGYASMGSSVGGYQIPDGILEVTTPNNDVDMRSASNYAFGEVTSSVYVVRENGSTRHYVIGEFEDDVTPTILINFATSATAAAAFSDMDNAGGGPSAMVVESVDLGYDDDDDEVYTMNGYMAGSEATIKTNKNTIFGWAQNNMYSEKNLTAEALWTTEKGVQGANGKKPDQAINEGDFMLYNPDGKVMIKFLDVVELANYAAVYDQTGSVAEAAKEFTANHNPIGHDMYSTSRVQFFFGRIVDYDAESAWVQIDVSQNDTPDIRTLVFDPAKTIDIVEVNGTRATINPEGAGTAADIQRGDYMYISTANKGEINFVVDYRFN